MPLAYDPSARANDFQVAYMVKTTGDRWFIPYNDAASTADQVARCSVMTGNTADGSTCGLEQVET